MINEGIVASERVVTSEWLSQVKDCYKWGDTHKSQVRGCHNVTSEAIVISEWHHSHKWWEGGCQKWGNTQGLISQLAAWASSQFPQFPRQPDSPWHLVENLSAVGWGASEMSRAQQGSLAIIWIYFCSMGSRVYWKLFCIDKLLSFIQNIFGSPVTSHSF